MEEGYLQWHDMKASLNQRRQVPVFREQEIWWCAIGLNIGSEQNGKNAQYERPVLVIRKFTDKLFCGLPLTSKRKEGSFYHSLFLDGEAQTVVLAQIRTLSAHRLIRRKSKLNDDEFLKLKTSLSSLLFKEEPRLFKTGFSGALRQMWSGSFWKGSSGALRQM